MSAPPGGAGSAPPRLLRRRTKIVATLGPASSAPATVAALVAAGVDVFRLNFSHGERAAHAVAAERVRAAAAQAGVHVALLADLGGPKIRAGRFPGGSVELREGERVTVTTRDVPGGPGLVPTTYTGLARDVRPGDRILLDDGLLELRVERTEPPDVACTVVHGGTLRDRKGMNLPGVAVSAPALTEKDREDARFALALGVDYLALSFVRRPSDLESLRALVAEAGGSAWIVAKIEKPEALAALGGILEAADAVMVARGDLGVELPPERVPLAQDELVDEARARRRPAIVATQMLESMVASARPTRAEVSDVAHAVASGTDAIMLSAETAAGAHPVLAVEMMDRVARETEAQLWRRGAFRSVLDREPGPPPLPLGDAVARATAQLSRDLLVRMVLVVSQTGRTALEVAAARPAAPVVALSSDPGTCRRMCLVWGVVPRLVEPARLEDLPALAAEAARELGLAAPGEHVLVVQGFRPDPADDRPAVQVLRV